MQDKYTQAAYALIETLCERKGIENPYQRDFNKKPIAPEGHAAIRLVDVTAAAAKAADRTKA